MGVVVIGDKMVLNRMKWYQVAKRGDVATEEHLAAYIKLGGAVRDVEVKKPKKKKVVKVEKKAKKKK